MYHQELTIISLVGSNNILPSNSILTPSKFFFLGWRHKHDNSSFSYDHNAKKIMQSLWTWKRATRFYLNSNRAPTPRLFKIRWYGVGVGTLLIGRLETEWDEFWLSYGYFLLVYSHKISFKASKLNSSSLHWLDYSTSIWHWNIAIIFIFTQKNPQFFVKK